MDRSGGDKTGRSIRFTRRAFNRWMLAAIPAASPMLRSEAFAQAFPSRQVQIVVTYGPGGPNDVLGRYIADKLSSRLGRTVIVENRAGAGGTTGLRAVMNLPPDGHNIVVLSVGHAIEQAFRKDPGYDLAKDFTPVGSLAIMAQVLVSRPDFRFKTMQELINHLKTSPRTVACGTASPPQVEYLRAAAGVELTVVPYKGAALAVQDVLGGQVDLALPALPEVVSHLEAGTLRAIGVCNRHRLPRMPDLPTIAETVPGFALEGWYGLVVTARTPTDIVERLQREVSAITATAEFKDFLEKRSFDQPVPLAEFPTVVANEVRQFQKLVSDQKLPQHE